MARAFSTTTRAGDRVALALAYNGSAYHGWQAQRCSRTPTVQEALETVLSRIADAPVAVQCAGRTDTGVHATAQIVHFDSPSDRAEKAWVFGANSNLPADISVSWARPVSADFHARFAATSRRYRYLICNTPTRPAGLTAHITHIGVPLDARRMHCDAQCLLGEQDFSAFRGAGCQSNTPMRNVQHIRVVRRGDVVIVDIQANAFLLHMVRNIVGVLIAVGSGQAGVGWTAEVLASRDRTRGGVTAPPQGLYLVQVGYPAHFGLPAQPLGPLLVTLDDGWQSDA
ncbi:MAG: tRNA pseudouridine(38-40) synthase TruA [Spongiibacteraceae bacterium]|jgi:tRNA pseudouridine38-40 synthase|nr:tRNA pseudouridine(38-40) synthase TruA [Spongiibacteraceae bacterium]